MRKASWLNNKTILVKDAELLSYSSYIESKALFFRLRIDKKIYDLDFYNDNFVDILHGNTNVLIFIVKEKTEKLIEQVNKINNKND